MDINKRDRLVCLLYINNVRVQDIVNRVGVSRGTIYRILKEHDVELRLEKRKRVKEYIIGGVCGSFDEGVGVSGISEKFNLDKRLVRKILKTFRRDKYREYLRGEVLKRELEREGKKEKVKRARIKDKVRKQLNEGVYYVLTLKNGDNVLVTAKNPPKELVDKSIMTIDFSKVLTDENELRKLIAYEIGQGTPYLEIMKKYDVGFKFLYDMVGGMGEPPKYCPYK